MKNNMFKYIKISLVSLNIVFFMAINIINASAGTVIIGSSVGQSTANTSDESNKYCSAWQYWSQGASMYSGMRSVGCRVVAYAKMIKEAGYAQFSDPDAFFAWGVGKKYFRSYSNAYDETTFGFPLQDYISMN